MRRYLFLLIVLLAAAIVAPVRAAPTCKEIAVHKDLWGSGWQAVPDILIFPGQGVMVEGNQADAELRLVSAKWFDIGQDVPVQKEGNRWVAYLGWAPGDGGYFVLNKGSRLTVQVNVHDGGAATVKKLTAACS